MATHDYVLDNASGAAFRTDLNNALAAIVSNNSNSSEPATKYAYQWWADTSANVLKIRNSSNNAWITLFTLAGGVDVDSASFFNANVTFTGASANIIFDESDSALEFADNAKAIFGTGNDLQIVHDTTNSNITNNTGQLNLLCNDIRLLNLGASTALLKAFNAGAVELYNDGSKKLETISTGVNVTSANDAVLQVTTTGSGSTDDARIELITQESTFTLQNDRSLGTDGALTISAGSESGVNIYKDAQVELYHNGNLKLSTVSNGIEVTGHVRPISSRDNTDDIGGASQRWDDIFATNSTIQTSDEKEKENISNTDLGLDFINKLTPKSFKFKGKTRTHYGLIAQDIETVITDLGKTTTQFAPLIKNTLEDGTERYGLRYTELLSPLIKAVQELSAKVVALESA